MDYLQLGLLLVFGFTTIELVGSISPPLILTPLLKENKTEEARKQSAVDPKLFLNVTSHSGFLTVDEKYNSNTFFWYFPVADKSKAVNETPWIIWLQGGPGASSLDGLFDEIGPFQYEKELKLRNTSWTKDYSVVFIDNPIGAGYSFTNSTEGYARNMSMYSEHLFEALQQFLHIFSELRQAPLFIAGESYAGRYVPALAEKIRINENLPLFQIKLKGLILGNPVLNREDIANLTDAFYQWGLIDTQGVLACKSLQDQYTAAIDKKNNSLAYKLRNDLLDKLQDISLQQQTFNLLKDRYHFEDFEELYAMEQVREAIHVGDTKFDFDNGIAHTQLIPDFLNDVSPMIEKLLNDYRVLIYCGQLDLTAPCVPNAEARRKWRWNRRDEFLKAPRVPWWYNETIAGYVKKGGGLTEALVRGAGHLAPLDKPQQVLDLITDFINDVDPDQPPNYASNPSDTPQIEDDITKDTQDKTILVLPNTISTSTTKSVKTEPPKTQSQIESIATVRNISAGTIASIMINIVLGLIIVTGLILYYRHKKRTAEFFYSNVDNTSDDLFLT